MKYMSNNNRRALAGSSRRPCRTCDQNWIATAVVMALSSSGKQSFNALLHTTQAGQAPLAGALAQLRGDHFILQDQHGDFQLDSAGLDLIAASRKQCGRQSRRAG
jgi:hypothetical protein